MARTRILPRLVLSSIQKSAGAYLPYLFATSFAVSVFFIFSAIASNPIMQSMPHAAYLLVLMQVGKVLLGMILVPFLFYTNSFLMKQRKKELGLYSILGLEKRHIGCMIAAETVMVYLAALALGIVMALVFSRLIFLLLLNITRLPVDIQFTAEPACYLGTATFFGCIFLLNLIINLVQVSRAKPADLFQSARRGEKRPKRVWPVTLLGVLALGGGYYLGITFRLNGYFPFVFFGAVVLVVLGTYCLFAAGIISLLRLLQKNPRYYYHKQNFVTVSGMLYRMRKNAASLSNLCIFSTMIIVTLVCTVSLFGGMDAIADYRYPYDVDIRMVNSRFSQREQLNNDIRSLTQETGASVTDLVGFEYVSLALHRQDNVFRPVDDSRDYSGLYTVRVLRLEDYNRIEGTRETLRDGEVLCFSTQKDLGYDQIVINDQLYRVKKELQSLRFENKEPKSYGDTYYLIVPGLEDQQWLFRTLERKDDQWIYNIRFNLDGPAQAQEALVQRLGQQLSQIPALTRFDNRVEGEKEDASLLGGLLFLGVFFGIIFLVCMVMIMYYKQLSEGFEDKINFDVMQQVGMSQPQVKATIRRQIQMVFLLPLAMALLHTAVALGPVEIMLGTLYLYRHQLVFFSALGVSAAFAVIYLASYHITAKAYYRIVRR